MINKISKRARTIEPSTSSEILRYASRPEFINFGGGVPATEALPVEEFNSIFKNLFDKKVQLPYNIILQKVICH